MQVFADGKEWCEELFEKSFKYERHEAKAYSMAWNSTDVDKSTTDDLTVSVHDTNPNNHVYTDKAWPQPCNFTEAKPVRCTDSNRTETATSPSPACWCMHLPLTRVHTPIQPAAMHM
jgi:hypothetical protein